MAFCADKDDACVAEALLLRVAGITGKKPSRNVIYGDRAVMRAIRKHGEVIVEVRGRDPLSPPTARRLKGPKYVTAEKDPKANDYIFYYEWKK